MNWRPPTPQERSALLHFELLYEEWRQCTEAWLEAEARLWAEALRWPGSAECGPLRAEAERLRDKARAAYLRVMDALLQETVTH